MVAHEHPLKFFLEGLSVQKKKKKKGLFSWSIGLKTVMYIHVESVEVAPGQDPHWFLGG